MSKTIDCLIIGHNEMDFSQYERTVREMGEHSGAYRDLNLNFIRYNNKPYSIPEIYNLLYTSEMGLRQPVKPLTMGESFSASIAYLGTYLHRRGYTFDYVNTFQDSKEELAGILTNNNILAVAVTTTLYVSVFPILEIIDFIKRYNTTARIIIGGPFIATRFRTQEPEALKYLLESTIGADFYVNSSQGESALVKIINALKNGLPFAQIHNIYFKQDGGYVSTPVVPENNKLSENMVNWDLFSNTVGEHVNARTSISCPFSCAFCGFPQHAGKYQVTEPEAIEKELKQLAKIGTVKSVHFIDDTFNIPANRFKQMLRMKIKNKFPFRWHSYFRCSSADREMVELMKESGCEGVFLGLESGNDQILKNMNKAANTDKYLRSIELLKAFGIVTFGDFIIGFPGETEQTVQDTVTFIEKSGLDFYRTQLWYCEPITPIWQEREKYHIEDESFQWRHHTMDSKQACDWIDHIFLTLKGPVWVPQYNFDFAALWHLVHRGMGLEQLKRFLTAFNEGVKEKLTVPGRRETSYQVIKKLKESCIGNALLIEPPGDEKKTTGHFEADFDF